jgi:integrase
VKGCIDKYSTKGSSKPHWRYRIYRGKDAAGKKQFVIKAGFKKQGEAEDAMRAAMAELEAKDKMEPVPKKTLGEWLRTWLETYAADRCQPKTLERYQQLAAYILNAPEGPVQLSEVDLADLTHTKIESALYGLLKLPGKRREHISARTVRHVAGLLSVALNKAFRLELVPVNPMLRVELPAVQKKDAHSLTPDQIRALRDTCRGDWTFALVELALAIGARRGELLALEWADLDWVSSTLTITKSLEQTKAGLRIKRPKNGKTRSCRLPQSAVVALQFLREQQAEHRRMFSGDYQDHRLIFCQPDGNYHEPDLVSQVIVRRMRRAGITGASFHTLPHTHASNLLSRGVPLPAVSARLGHADANVTARVYSHALPADDQRAADVWDGIVNDAVQ